MKVMSGFLLILLLSACGGGLRIDHRYSATGQNSRVQYIVLHYTSANLPRSLALLTGTEVSAHYLIDASPPTVYQLVDESRRAWHAGISEWQGRTWLNGISIGIEMVNPGFVDTPTGRYWQPYTQAQIDALIPLLKDIMQRHQLPVGSIVGHSDIAPQRKSDPGPLFPWKQLADAGLLPWPDAAAVAREQVLFQQQLPDASWFQQQLATQGYAVPQSGQFDEATHKVIRAFQMKYRQRLYDGQADAETAALLQVLKDMAR
jgi:N-acetylmuramoyl-L-alanine amidase